MPRWLTIPAAAVLAAALGGIALDASPAAATEGEVTAYAWANKPTLASYHPSAAYAYNSTGGDITVTRASAGVYTVVVEGAATTGGVAQAQAYGVRHAGRVHDGGVGRDHRPGDRPADLRALLHLA